MHPLVGKPVTVVLNRRSQTKTVIAISASGIFVAKSMGWGASKDAIYLRFTQFKNGKWHVA